MESQFKAIGSIGMLFVAFAVAYQLFFLVVLAAGRYVEANPSSFCRTVTP